MSYKPQTLTVSDGGTGAKTLTGILTGNGTGAVTASTVTEFGVLVGGASNAVSSTAVGTAGEVLTSNGPGLAPTFQAGSGGGGISTINGDSGSVTGSTITFTTASPSNQGSTISFSGSSATMSLNVTDTNGNTIIGEIAGISSLTGANNTGFGSANLRALTTGQQNTAVGVSVLQNLTSGINNVAVGNASLISSVSGSNNVALGYGALTAMGSSGSNHIAIGSSAGTNYSGTENSNICIGNSGTNAESNTIRIGTQGSGSAQQNKCFIAGITGVTTSNTNYVTIDTSTGQLGAVATPASSFTWSAIGASQTLVVNQGVFCTSGAALSLALPATSAVGDTIEVALNGSTSWTITQPNAGTRIRIGISQTTLGVGGSLASTAQGDAVRLVCVTANALWIVTSMIGNITVV